MLFAPGSVVFSRGQQHVKGVLFEHTQASCAAPMVYVSASTWKDVHSGASHPMLQLVANTLNRGAESQLVLDSPVSGHLGHHVPKCGYNVNAEPVTVIPATPPKATQGSSYEEHHSCLGKQEVWFKAVSEDIENVATGEGRLCPHFCWSRTDSEAHRQETMGIQLVFWHLKAIKLWGAS